MKIKISKKDIIDTSKYDNLSLKEINKLLNKRKKELKKSKINNKDN